MRNFRKSFITTLIVGTAVTSLYGCGIFGGGGHETESEAVSTEEVDEQDDQEVQEASTFKESEKIGGLTFDHEVPVENSKYLKIDAYKDGYYVVKSSNGKVLDQMLIVPKGKSVPDGLSKDIIVVQQPVTSSKIDSITLAELLCEMNSDIADKLSLVTIKEEKIFIDAIVQNMEKGVIKYAGSSNKPDIQLIKDVSPQVYLCKPEFKKQESYKELQNEGIKPFVTYLHNEGVLGRIEWIKALGVIYGDLESAEKFYNEQKALVESIDKTKAGGKNFAMICLNKEKNKAYVRRTGDVIAKIGEAAGGVNKLADNPKGYWQSMSIDEFVSNFKDTDYLIYFDKHGDEVTSLKQLTEISDKLADFKAVQEGHVWRTRTDYLQMNKVGNMASELNSIFAEDKEAMKNTLEFVKVE